MNGVRRGLGDRLAAHAARRTGCCTSSASTTRRARSSRAARRWTTRSSLRFTQRRKIPFFEDGEIRIGESGAIVFYLADRYRDRGRLAPEPGTAARAAFEELAFFILMELDATALYVLRRHEGLPDVYGEAPEACAAARGYFQRMVGEIERRLADGRPHLLGEAFSAADLLLVELPRLGAVRRDSARRAARRLSRSDRRAPGVRARDVR